MNQNLSKLLSQLRDIWGQMGASQRISVVAATFVLLAGLGGVALWSSRTEYSLLYGRLNESDSAKVVAVLDEAKVPYRVSSDGSSVYVPSDKVHPMRAQLANKGALHGDGVGYEIFDKSNFGISDFVQRANYVRAVQGELARTISQFNDIESARVMVTLPENRLLLDKDKHPTAAVFVRARGSGPLDQQAINSIRFLVANSVEGLKAAYVSVHDSMGNLLSDNNENDTMGGLTSNQLQARRNLEQYLGKKAQDMLEAVLGPGQAIVRVSADINYDTITRTEEKFDPDGQVIKSQTKNDENNDSTTATSSSPVGISANTALDTNSTSTASTPLSNTKNRKTTSTVEYENARITSSVLQAAGGVRRLTAAVTVAARYEGEGQERKLAPRSTEELEKLRRIVSSAIGIQTGAGSSRVDTLSLEELPFNDTFATEVTRELVQQQKHELWWNIGRNVLYPLLAAAALFALFRLFKRTPVQEIPIGMTVAQLTRHRNGNGNGNGHGHPLGSPGMEPLPGVVNIDVLNKLIKENPANMTQAIRDWMNKGHTSES